MSGTNPSTGSGSVSTGSGDGGEEILAVEGLVQHFRGRGSAWAKAAAEGKRAAGSLASALSMIRTRDGGKAAKPGSSGSCGSFRIRAMTSVALRPGNGRRPVSTS